MECVSRSVVSPWTIAHQAPLSMDFSRQDYWSVLPFPSPGDPPDPGVKSGSPALQAVPLPSEPPRKPRQSPSVDLLVCIFVKHLLRLLAGSMRAVLLAFPVHTASPGAVLGP